MIKRILNLIIADEEVLGVILFDKYGNTVYENIKMEDKQQTIYKEELKILLQTIYKTEIGITSITTIYDKIKLLLFKIEDKLLLILLSPETNLSIVDLTFRNLFYKIRRYFYLKEKMRWKEVKVKLSKDVKKGEVKISKDFLKKWEIENNIHLPKKMEIESSEIKGLKLKIKTSKEKTDIIYINNQDGKKIGLQEEDLALSHLIESKAKIEEFFQ